MKNILGIDVGQKRIGIAISRDGIVSSFGIISNFDLDQAIVEIGQIIRKEQVLKIIIGVPKNKNTLQADKIHKVAIELAKKLNILIEYVDESFTSSEAERILKNSNLDPKTEKYKEEIDKISAKLILEQYLNNND
ncbi:MAG: Holliday junction resolvase-like protein, putative holliday junction resolvase [Candidatus Berkelbacteria bacterium]|nr:Holliday junction resolvase-like protein, putative holliday junction resolvase [Candidatus Berkelbacteria bacterium]